MSVRVRTVRLAANPQRRSARRSTRNPALITMGFINPEGRKMPRTKKQGARKASHRRAAARRSRPRAHHKTHRPRTQMLAMNPRRRRRRPTMHNARRRRSRNPTGGGVLRGGVNLLKMGLFALIGLVAARQLPQMFLGAANTGIWGYAANIATAAVVGWMAGRFISREAGNAMLLGGGLFVVNRAIGDYFSPVQKYLSLSGVGDPLALGDIRPGYFPLPVPVDANNNPIIPVEIDARRALAPAPTGGPQPAPASKMSGVGSPSGRFGGRF